jgi:hypothetical protein
VEIKEEEPTEEEVDGVLSVFNIMLEISFVIERFEFSIILKMNIFYFIFLLL